MISGIAICRLESETSSFKIISSKKKKVLLRSSTLFGMKTEEFLLNQFYSVRVFAVE